MQTLSNNKKKITIQLKTSWWELSYKEAIQLRDLKDDATYIDYLCILSDQKDADFWNNVDIDFGSKTSVMFSGLKEQPEEMKLPPDSEFFELDGQMLRLNFDLDEEAFGQRVEAENILRKSNSVNFYETAARIFAVYLSRQLSEDKKFRLDMVNDTYNKLLESNFVDVYRWGAFFFGRQLTLSASTTSV